MVYAMSQLSTHFVTVDHCISSTVYAVYPVYPIVEILLSLLLKCRLRHCNIARLRLPVNIAPGRAISAAIRGIAPRGPRGFISALAAAF